MTYNLSNFSIIKFEQEQSLYIYRTTNVGRSFGIWKNWYSLSIYFGKLAFIFILAPSTLALFIGAQKFRFRKYWYLKNQQKFVDREIIFFLLFFMYSPEQLNWKNDTTTVKTNTQQAHGMVRPPLCCIADSFSFFLFHQNRWFTKINLSWWCLHCVLCGQKEIWNCILFVYCYVIDLFCLKWFELSFSTNVKLLCLIEQWRFII